MHAYTEVDGVPAAADEHLLTRLLRQEWGFDGATMSDWGATRRTDEAGRAGMDLAMPGPVGPWGDALVAAVREGRVDEQAIDDKVLRILRLAARVGALDDATPPSPSQIGLWDRPDGVLLLDPQPRPEPSTRPANR